MRKQSRVDPWPAEVKELTRLGIEMATCADNLDAIVGGREELVELSIGDTETFSELVGVVISRYWYTKVHTNQDQQLVVGAKPSGH